MQVTITEFEGGCSLDFDGDQLDRVFEAMASAGGESPVQAGWSGVDRKLRLGPAEFILTDEIGGLVIISSNGEGQRLLRQAHQRLSASTGA